MEKMQGKTMKDHIENSGFKTGDKFEITGKILFYGNIMNVTDYKVTIKEIVLNNNTVILMDKDGNLYNNILDEKYVLGIDEELTQRVIKFVQLKRINELELKKGDKIKLTGFAVLSGHMGGIYKEIRFNNNVFIITSDNSRVPGVYSIGAFPNSPFTVDLSLRYCKIEKLENKAESIIKEAFEKVNQFDRIIISTKSESNIECLVITKCDKTITVLRYKDGNECDIHYDNIEKIEFVNQEARILAGDIVWMLYVSTANNSRVKGIVTQYDNTYYIVEFDGNKIRCKRDEIQLVLSHVKERFSARETARISRPRITTDIQQARMYGHHVFTFPLYGRAINPYSLNRSPLMGIYGMPINNKLWDREFEGVNKVKENCDKIREDEKRNKRDNEFKSFFDDLTYSRKQIKTTMKKYKKGSLGWNKYNKIQLEMKKEMNSLYKLLGGIK